MPTSITVKLPKNEAERASRAMKDRGIRRIDRHVRALIREDFCAREIDKLEALILEGERSGPAKPLDEAEWKAIRDECRARVAKRRKR